MSGPRENLEVAGREQMAAEPQLLPLSLLARPESCKSACSGAEGQRSDLPARAVSSLLGGFLVEFAIPTG